MKGVFDTRSDSGYDDEIRFRYHFPSQYRAIADQLVGNWIVYREPRRSQGRQAYVATARVKQIVPDKVRQGHYYALVEDFLQLDPPVPFKREDSYREAPLRALDPECVGAYLQGKSIRLLSDEDFSAIVYDGVRATLDPANVARVTPDNGLGEEALEYIYEPLEEQKRHIEQILLNRKIRDANFRRVVCDAYDNRCAVTRLRIVNGGGRAEVQAAHIWPVAAGGPDVVQNGLALSATVHWLFDRYLISLTDEYRLLVSHNKVPAEFRTLFTKQDERIHLPKNRSLWPHPAYIAKHRDLFTGRG